MGRSVCVCVCVWGGEGGGRKMKNALRDLKKKKKKLLGTCMEAETDPGSLCIFVFYVLSALEK